MDNGSELSIFRTHDDSIQERLKQQIAEVKKAKQGLTSAASAFSEKYIQEINEGTKRQQLLIEEGAMRGLSKEEALKKETSFCPTVRTPILNMLHFLIREHPDANKINFNRIVEHVDKDHLAITEELNFKYGNDQHGIEAEETAENAPEMETFIYGDLTSKTYQTIKKLKALSQSPNKAEAFAAYTKCVAMCKRFNLEFDRVKIT
jgi:hypothetical protein